MNKIFCVALLLATTCTFAQVKLQGVVKDSLQNPLELANVVAINQATSGLESYGITDANGNFKLQLGKNGSYKIQVSYIGLKTFEEVLTTVESDITKVYTLQDDNSLDEVEISYEMPVTIRGDTLIYNADSFSDGTE